MTSQKNPGSGPPRGPGHYSDDGRRWWDDRHRRWFPVTDQEDQLEIEAQDLGSTSLPARLLTTLVTQYGTPYYRFVGHARSADARWPTYQVTGASFPATGEPASPSTQTARSITETSHVVLAARKRVDTMTSQEFADRLMYAIGAADSIARSVGLRPDPALYNGRRTDDGLELVMESATARETWEITVRKLS